MIRRALLLTLAMAVAAAAAAEGSRDLMEQVRSTEAAFAKTMADRDHAAFAAFVADEAVFVGGAGALRGKAAVAAGWKPLFEGNAPPFAWTPETVEVLESGTLALSSGPVLDPQGGRVGTFVSVWRLEGDGRWRIVFDRGCPPCAAAK